MEGLRYPLYWILLWPLCFVFTLDFTGGKDDSALVQWLASFRLKYCFRLRVEYTMTNLYQKSRQLRKVLLVRIVKNGLVRLRKVRLGYGGFRTLPIRGSRGVKPHWFGRLGKVLLVRIVKNAR